MSVSGSIAALLRIAPQGTIEKASSPKVKNTRPMTMAWVRGQRLGRPASALASAASSASCPQSDFAGSALTRRAYQSV